MFIILSGRHLCVFPSINKLNSSIIKRSALRRHLKIIKNYVAGLRFYRTKSICINIQMITVETQQYRITIITRLKKMYLKLLQYCLFIVPRRQSHRYGRNIKHKIALDLNIHINHYSFKTTKHSFRVTVTFITHGIGL